MIRRRQMKLLEFNIDCGSSRAPFRGFRQICWEAVLLGCILFCLLISLGAADPNRRKNLEDPLQYPYIFDSLLQCLNSLQKEKPAILQVAILKSDDRNLPFAVKHCHQTIQSARKAVFYLEYFQRTLSKSELDQEHRDFRFSWVTADSVDRLVSDARDFFVKNKIPFARGNEFKLPQLPK